MASRSSIAVAVALVAGVVVYFAFARRAPPPHARAKTAEHPDDDSYRETRDTEDDHGGAESTAEGPSRHAEPPLPKQDRARADEMRAKILALLAEAGPGRVAMPSAPPKGGSQGSFREMPSSGSGNQAQGEQGKYIQSVVRDDFFPLARQCYGAAQAAHPSFQGTVDLHFRIVGDKRVGGVVDEAFVGDGGDLHDQDFSECMTQSMMSVSFDAPPNDGEVTVVYPISFAPDGPDAGS